MGRPLEDMTIDELKALPRSIKLKGNLTDEERAFLTCVLQVLMIQQASREVVEFDNWFGPPVVVI